MTERYTVQAVGFDILMPETEDKSPSVKVELRVVEGPDAGKTLWYFGSLHDNAQTYTAEALRNLGWRCTDLTKLDGLGSIRAIAVAKTSEYKGRTSTSWMIFPIRSPRPTLEKEQAASFAARFKALAASVAPVERTDLNAAIDMPPATVTKRNTMPSTEGGASVPF